jgi:hypothetical protein
MKLEKSIDEIVFYENVKQDIYNTLKEHPMSRKACAMKLNLTKNQFKHHSDNLLKNGHLKLTIGKCKILGGTKMHILSVNEYNPFVAKTREQIVKEKEDTKKKDEVFKAHVRVIRLIDKHPITFNKDKKKRREVAIQSSFSIL